MKAKARITGIAPISLLLPTNESTTHSVIKHDVITEMISHNARARFGFVTAAAAFT
jgi:hypothetical protein